MKKARIVHRGNRIGDLRHRIMVQVREIKSPNFQNVDFGIEFVDTAVWAGVKTLRGKTAFDDTGKEVDLTHEIYIRKMDGIEEGSFVQLTKGDRLRVISVDDYDERGEYLALSCSYRGVTEASKV